MKLSRILHAGYLFETPSTRVMFDPLFEVPFSVNGYAFPPVKFDTTAISKLKLDAIFISHYHDDHCSLESLNLLDRATPIYFYCVFDEIFQMLKDLGFQNVLALRLNEPVSIGEFKITPRRALDADVDCIFQIETATHKVLNVVDSWIDEETLELLRQEGPWDVVLWPFQTMREIEAIAPDYATPATGLIPLEWADQLRALCPRVIVPSSCQFIFEEWSWLNRTFFPISYAGFSAQMSELLPKAQTLRLNPGCALVLEKDRCERGTPLEWIHPNGDQDLDYDYAPMARVPSTTEIAERFAKLTTVEKERVDLFLQQELLMKFRALEATHFFEEPRIWQLTIFDGDSVQNFHYRIVRNEIEVTDDQASEWKTEIIARKLYGALENGESLSSLYLRVNQPDILEDPLLRVLFNGEIGSYQRAQLKRLSHVLQAFYLSSHNNC